MLMRFCRVRGVWSPEFPNSWRGPIEQTAASLNTELEAIGEVFDDRL